VNIYAVKEPEHIHAPGVEVGSESDDDPIFGKKKKKNV